MGKKIAYFSMEIGLESKIPTYSGGLGILAGDTLKSAADTGLPLVGVSLIYHKGYVKQKLDKSGYQCEEPVVWDPSSKMKLLPNEVSIKLEDRIVKVKAWEYTIKGESGHKIPVYFLDTDLEDNAKIDRDATNHLYIDDNHQRLIQEAVLGIGGVRMLRTLGYDIDTYHMNEGHAALLTLELLKERAWKDENVKKSCVFTTHSPVAGHDSFDYALVDKVLKEAVPWHIRKIAGDNALSMTLLAMNLSRYVNAVSKKHAQVSKSLFPNFNIDSITNGVHPFTWTSKSFQNLYDKHIPGWRKDPKLLKKVSKIPYDEIWKAHQTAKKELLKKIPGFDINTLTIGYARRAAPYKRMSLIFSDLERLAKLGQGKLQLVFAGKSHPNNHEGKEVIRKITQTSKNPDKIKLVFLEDYDMELGKLLTSGCDVWLNNPTIPLEACGTSGMKACLNGVPHFSTLDGWWLEGYEEDVTGWAIGSNESDDRKDAENFYEKLENKIIPLYYENKEKWAEMMKNVITLNASKFNSHRMVMEYAKKAYLL